MGYARRCGIDEHARFGIDAEDLKQGINVFGGDRLIEGDSDCFGIHVP